MRPVLAVLALLALAGCSHRDRANPFDPRNPDTRGGPSGFAAVAGDGRVDLRWNPASGSGLQGFRVHRRTASDTAYAPISAVLPPSTSGYADIGALNGLEHRYRLYYVFDDGSERGPPAEDVATPGRSRPWVVDGSLGQLLRLTPDGRRVAATYDGFSGPTAVAVDSARGHVWVSDSFGGRVAMLDPYTGVTVSIPGLVTPAALAVDPLDRVTWVCDEAGRLHEFDPAGNPLGNPIEPLDLPIGVAIDPFDRSVVVCERGASRVRRHAPDHTLLATLAVDRPSRVAVDSLTRRVWVTSFEGGTVTRIPPSFSTIELTVPGFQGPIGIAIDSKHDRVWVADALANQVVAMDRAGAILFRVGGMDQARDLAVDRETGEVWVVLPDRGEVARLSKDGALLQRMGGLAQPLGVAVDPGRR